MVNPRYTCPRREKEEARKMRNYEALRTELKRLDLAVRKSGRILDREGTPEARKNYANAVTAYRATYLRLQGR
jgi:hypothetical protein